MKSIKEDTDRQPIANFFDAITPDLNCEYIEIRRIGPQGARGSRFYTNADDLLADHDELRELSKSENIFFGVCPRFREGGAKKDVRRVLCLWADVDAKDFHGGKEEALRRIQEFPVLFTALVDSGHGYHAYWRLKELEEINGPEDESRIKGYLHGIADALGGDHEVCHLAGLLRLPGMINSKDPSSPVPVQLVELNPSQECNPEDFESYITISRTGSSTSPSITQKNEPGWIAETLRDLEDGNRNASFTKIVGRLHHDSYQSEEMLALLVPHAEKCDLPHDELDRIVKGIERYPVEETSMIQPEPEPILTVAREVGDLEKYIEQYRGSEFIGLPQKVIPSLDENTLGLRDLMLLVAMPNVGKTALATQFGMDVVMHNEDACFLFLSLEMLRRDIMVRMKCRLAEMDWATLMFGSDVVRGRETKVHFTVHEQERLVRAEEILSRIGDRICILDERNFPCPTIENVLEQLYLLKEKTGTTRAFILIDYLQVWPIPPNEMKGIRTDLGEDKWRIGEMKRMQNASNDAVLVISESRKPPGGSKEQWGGNLSDVMGAARGAYTPSAIFLFRPFSNDEIADLYKLKKDVTEEILERRSELSLDGKSLCKLEIAKGRDGFLRNSIDLTYQYRKSIFEEGVKS